MLGDNATNTPKLYNPHPATVAEITSRKYCHQCKADRDTYWEKSFCKKNPEGIDDITDSLKHGNEDTCDEGYCSPDTCVIEKQDITPQYVREHAVYERCAKCHQYCDSAGPQADESVMEPCPNCDGTGVFNVCTECGGGPGCVYCTAEDGDEDTPQGKDCVMCSGTGKVDNTQILCTGDKDVRVAIKSTGGARLTRQQRSEIAEAFQNQNIADWEKDGNTIHERYTLNVGKDIVWGDDDHIEVLITSPDGKDCGVLHVHGMRDEINDCKNCHGRGYFMEDSSTGTYDEITCYDCDGTGVKRQ